MNNNSDQVVQRVMVVTDLWHYRDIAMDIDKQIGGIGVALVNRQIQEFIEKALRNAGIIPQTIPAKFTGDGKILAFETAESGCRFAEALHTTADLHNEGREVLLHRRHFRIGIWHGEIVLELHTAAGEVTGHEFHGVAVANASRLEGACITGEILICPKTWAQLPSQMKPTFGKEEQIGVKGGILPAHRRKVIEPVPTTKAPVEPDLDRTADLLEKLISRRDIPHINGNLEDAIRRGIAGVGAVTDRLALDGRQLSLEQISRIISEAISHGAGIYNDGSPLGCAQIYLHAAKSMLKHLPDTASVMRGPFPKGSRLAAEWLYRIVIENPTADASNADDLAWELRFAFDSIMVIPLLDQITDAITAARTLLGKPDPARIAGVVAKLIGISESTQPQVCAYQVRHTAMVILWVLDRGYGGAPPPGRMAEWAEKVRPVVEANPRITHENASQFASEFPALLQSF